MDYLKNGKCLEELEEFTLKIMKLELPKDKKNQLRKLEELKVKIVNFKLSSLKKKKFKDLDDLKLQM